MPNNYCTFHGEFGVKCRGCETETNPSICLQIGKRIPGRTYSVCDAHLRYEGKGMDLSCVDCDRAALAAAGIPYEYEPLFVTAVASNKKPGKVVAFIDKQLCFFENDCMAPPVGTTVEVMLTRPLYHTKPNPDNPDGMRYRDWNSLLAILLRPVSSEYQLVHHRGFECSGSMCQTTATAREPGLNGKSLGWITPGRTDVWVAENVNTSFNKQESVPKRPGKIWVKQHEGRLRAEGLARPEDALYFKAIKR
jgi:hypothetical protein